MEYAKAWVATVGSILTGVIVGLPALGVEVPQWLAILTLVATVVGVAQVPNKPTEAQKEKIIEEAILDPESPVTIL